MQQPEERQADPAALVPCPGCDRCVNGYIVHLSAGRPTSAHEHVFLLSKQARYFFDADAVREPHTGPPVEHFGNVTAADKRDLPANVRPARAYGVREYNPLGRSCRNVWTIATHAYSDAHFATFPPALVERCIRAGTSERGCCAACGKPWVRQVEHKIVKGPAGCNVNNVQDRDWSADRNDQGANRQKDGHLPGWISQNTTTGWAAGCKCGAEVRPCVVLDCFAGAGTTGLVADRLQRDAIMIELNPSYVNMAETRIVDDAPLFSSWPPAEDPADARMALDALQRDLFAMAAD